MCRKLAVLCSEKPKKESLNKCHLSSVSVSTSTSFLFRFITFTVVQRRMLRAHWSMFGTHCGRQRNSTVVVSFVGRHPLWYTSWCKTINCCTLTPISVPDALCQSCWAIIGLILCSLSSTLDLLFKWSMFSACDCLRIPTGCRVLCVDLHFRIHILAKYPLMSELMGRPLWERCVFNPQ